MTQNILISLDARGLMLNAAAYLETKTEQALQARGVCHIALSGGNTPKALYELLASPEWRARFDWSRIHAWFGDERDVPSDDAASNFNMANEALLSRVPIPPENVHRVKTERGARAAAEAYEAEMRAQLGDLCEFDVVLLGMGEDGHTASLFPGTLGAISPERLVMAHRVPKVNMMRVTFTPRLINAARCVIFLVSGASKAEVLNRVLNGDYDPNTLPSQLIEPTDGELMWLLDRDAARLL